MKMQAHPEHEQDHADLGALRRGVGVGDEPRRIRAHNHPRQEVADDGREPGLLSEETEEQCGAQPPDQGQDEVDVVRHEEASSLYSDAPAALPTLQHAENARPTRRVGAAWAGPVPERGPRPEACPRQRGRP
jgi:hypothetical protein